MKDGPEKECPLWTGSEKIPRVFRSAQQDEWDSISGYLSRSHVIMDDDRVMAAAFGDETVREYEAELARSAPA